MSRRSRQTGAKRPQTPLEKARANSALKEGLLRTIAAKLRGEKPVPATELTEGVKARRNDAGR